MKKCPGCTVTFDALDDVATHLMKTHSFDYDGARLWLMEAVEKEHPSSSCPCEECRYWDRESKKEVPAA